LLAKAHRHGLRFHKANQPGYALERSAILGNAALYGAIAGLGFAQAGPRQAIAGPTRWGVAGIGVNLRPKTSENSGFAALSQRLFPRKNDIF